MRNTNMDNIKTELFASREPVQPTTTESLDMVYNTNGIQVGVPRKDYQYGMDLNVQKSQYDTQEAKRADLTVGDYVSDAGTSFVNGIKQTVTSSVIDSVNRVTDSPEPGYKVDFDGIRENFHSSEWDYMIGADSTIDFERRAKNAATRAQVANSAQLYGATSQVANFVGSMVDPVAIATSVGVFGMAGKALRGATKVRQTAVQGALGAGEGLLYGSALAKEDPNITTTDVLIDALIGGALGAGIGALTSISPEQVRIEDLMAIDKVEVVKHRKAHIEYAQAERAWKNADKSTRGKRPKKPPKYKPSDETLQARKGDALLNAVQRANTEIHAQEVQLNGQPTNITRSTSELIKEGESIDEAVNRLASEAPVSTTELPTWNQRLAGKLGFSTSSQWARSTNPALRSIGRMLWDSPTGLNQGIATVGSYKELFNSQMVSLLNKYEPTRRAWVNKRLAGKEYLSNNANIRVNDDFQKAVAQELDYRYMNPDHATQNRPQLDADIQAVADMHDEVTALSAKLRKESGVHGAEYIEPKSGYRHIKWDGASIVELERQLGTKGVIKFVQEAYEEAIPELVGTNKGEIFAKAVVRRAKQGLDDTDMNVGALSSQFGWDNFVASIQQLGLKQADLDEMESIIVRDMADAGKESSLKARTSINLSKSITLPDGTEFRIGQLTDQDVFRGLASTIENTSGYSAFAKFGVKSQADMRKLENLIKGEYASAHGTPMNDVDLHDLMSGFFARPMQSPESSNVRRVVTMARLSMLNQTGFPQFAEFGMILGEYVGTGAFKYMPHLATLRRDALTGRLDNKVLAEMEAAINVRLNNEVDINLGRVMLDENNDTAGKIGRSVDNVLNNAQYVQGWINGMHGIQGAQRIMAASAFIGRAFSVHMDQLAGKIRPSDMRRLKASGIDEDLWKRVTNEFKKATLHADGSIDKLNVDKWNASTRDDFFMALDRSIKTTVQGRHIGGNSLWLSRQTGRSLTALMSHPLEAWDRNLLRNVAYGDPRALSQVLAATSFGMAVYTARTAINYAGTDGLEEKLTVKNIAKGGIAMSTVASILPDGRNLLIGLGVLPGEVYGRYGIGSAPLSYVQTLHTAASAGPAMFTEAGVSNSQAKALWSIPMMQNYYGMATLKNNLFEKDK